MVTAFVLTGGGSLGAVQVGALQALAEHGVRPDLLVGTSAGSLNAAFVAAYGLTPQALGRLSDLWIGLRRRDLFAVSPLSATLAATGRRGALCSPAPLARLLAAQLPFTDLQDAAVPVHAVATDFLTGEDVLLSSGNAVEALCASCAVPGVFPPVRRDGRLLCDGALASSAGVTQAVRLGADRVYLLPGGTSCALARAPRHPLTAALHGLTLLLQQRALVDARANAGLVDLRVIPPLCPLAVSAADFGQARSLIARAHAAASRWLDAGHDRQDDPARHLGLHGHARRPAPAGPAGRLTGREATLPAPG